MWLNLPWSIPGGLAVHRPCTSSLLLARIENQNAEGGGSTVILSTKRHDYQLNDTTGQNNRIIKPQVRRPSEGVALILFGPLTPRSCLTTHSAKGISVLPNLSCCHVGLFKSYS